MKMYAWKVWYDGIAIKHWDKMGIDFVAIVEPSQWRDFNEFRFDLTLNQYFGYR